MKTLKQITADSIMLNYATFFKSEIAKRPLPARAFIAQLVLENKTKDSHVMPSVGKRILNWLGEFWNNDLQPPGVHKDPKYRVFMHF